MPSKEDSGSKELVPFSLLLVNVLAIVLGLGAYPIASAGAGVAGLAAQYASEYAERKRRSKLDRLRALVAHLQKRLEVVEERVDDEKTDLFVEVIARALDDDEARKDPVYAALLGWIARASPNRARVRILSDAVRQLSYVELFCLLQSVNGRIARRVHEQEGIDETVLMTRLRAFGLENHGVRVVGHATPLAQILKDNVALSDLEPPNEIAKHPERWLHG